MITRAGLLTAALVLVPTGVQWNAHGNGGHMQHMLPPEGCTDRSTGVPFAGASGELTYRSEGSGTEWDHRFQARVGMSGLVGDVATSDTDAGRRQIFIGYGRATVGWDSRYAGFRLGVYGGNVDEGEDSLVLPAGSVRIGTRTGFLRASLLDQPHCYPANCVLGLEGGADVLSVGGSVGITTSRVFVRGRIPGIIGGLDLRGGFYVGMPDNASTSSSVVGKDYVFSVGIGGYLDATPTSPTARPASHSGPPGMSGSN